jgi:hypothetical protein
MAQWLETGPTMAIKFQSVGGSHNFSIKLIGLVRNIC